MRRVLGWITLAVGVAIVAAMAWYGAVALFGDEEPIRIGSDQDVERDCAAGSEQAAEAARDAFLEEYVDDEAASDWFSGAGVSHTRVLDATREFQRMTFGYVVPPVRGKGSFLEVMQVPGANAPVVPACLGDVPVVVIYGGPIEAY